MNQDVLNAKKQIVSDLVSSFKESNLSAFVNYKGMTVSELTDFRLKVDENKGKSIVFKNTLIKKALQELGIDVSNTLLSGPTLLVSTQSNSSEVSKVIVDLLKEKEGISLKGAVFNDKEVEASLVNQLAKLPSRDVLIATLVGSVKAPLVGLVRTLSSPTAGLINVLNAIKQKNQEVT